METIELIERKIASIENALHFLTSLHATNEIVLYSPTIASQVGKSYAAHSFNVFQRSLYELEITRLLSLWHSPKSRRDRDAMNSFPTIAQLIAENGVRAELERRLKESLRQQHITDLSDDVDHETALRASFCQHAEGVYTTEVDEIVDRITAIENSSSVVKLANFRNKHVAHLLDETYLEHGIGSPISMPKHGEEDELLTASLELHRGLLSIIKHTWIDWSVWTSDCRRNAKYLWEGCSIKPLR